MNLSPKEILFKLTGNEGWKGLIKDIIFIIIVAWVAWYELLGNTDLAKANRELKKIKEHCLCECDIAKWWETRNLTINLTINGTI